LVPAAEDGRATTLEEEHRGKPKDGTKPEDDHQAAAAVHGAEVQPENEQTATALAVHSAEVKPDDDRAPPEDEKAAAAPAVHSAEVKPDDWAKWPEPPPPIVDYSFSSDGSAGSGAAPTLPTTTEAPQQVQTMAKLEGAAGDSEFDPQRIPSSVFQTRRSVSQAEWSMTSNESLFSIQGASDAGGPYAGSRSHFDFFYDEAMASADADSSKLPSVAEGTEPAESKEFAVPGSASSQASAGSSADAKNTAVFRGHESGSGGSSSNFSFAFPMCAPRTFLPFPHAYLIAPWPFLTHPSSSSSADWRRRRRRKRTSSAARCTSRWRRRGSRSRRRHRWCLPCRRSWR
jgi:hypothetical protein